VGVAAFAVVASAAGLRWAQGHKAPQDDIITEMAEPAPVSPPVALVIADAASAADAQASAVGGAASESPASTPVAAVPASALVVASAPRPAPRNSKRAAPEPAPTPIVVREEPPPPPPPVVAEPKPRPAPPRLPSPQEACADASFLARPMCIHRECQKPAQANHPICVENRRRYEAEEARNRQSPN
ncbi:MAG TPA: serine/threonine protein kinase, partial [Acidovorax sp.]|nr:serine/threonine protein kinase [Acidovorax sp.]